MKEELASIKECRNAQIVIGVVVIIYGLILAFSLSYNMLVAVGILVSFTFIGIIFLVMASDSARDYRDKLKELKSSGRKENV